MALQGVGLGTVGLSALTLTKYAGASGPWSARDHIGGHDSNRRDDEDGEDPCAEALAFSEAQLFRTATERKEIVSARRSYPRKKNEVVHVDPVTGEEVGTVRRRVMGFGLGFEKIFATTSIKLPISAYTIFVEMHIAHNQEVFSRCFNGMHTLFDLKKWIYEKLLIPSCAYDLSYAEPGKAALDDQLRLLTTQDSLDTRTFATTRAVHGMYRGIPGVHSIDDIGVTRLYLRLKCRTCGDLLNTLQTCQKVSSFGTQDPFPDTSNFLVSNQPVATVQPQKVKGSICSQFNRRMTLHKDSHLVQGGFRAGVPGLDPNIEDMWYKPDAQKHCLFHTRGYEYFEAARTHGGAAELGRIHISCGKEPSKKLCQQAKISSRQVAKISY